MTTYKSGLAAALSLLAALTLGACNGDVASSAPGSTSQESQATDSAKNSQCLVGSFVERYKGTEGGERHIWSFYDDEKKCAEQLCRFQKTNEYGSDGRGSKGCYCSFNDVADRADIASQCANMAPNSTLKVVVAPISMDTITAPNSRGRTNVIWGCYASCDLIRKN